MEGGFQKSLQLFVANGYCVFKNDICVDLPNVLGGKPDCVNSPLPRFFAKARCPPVLTPSGVVRLRREKSSNIIFHTLLFIRLFPSFFFFF